MQYIFCYTKNPVSFRRHQTRGEADADCSFDRLHSLIRNRSVSGNENVLFSIRTLAGSCWRGRGNVIGKCLRIYRSKKDTTGMKGLFNEWMMSNRVRMGICEHVLNWSPHAIEEGWYTFKKSIKKEKEKKTLRIFSLILSFCKKERITTLLSCGFSPK